MNQNDQQVVVYMNDKHSMVHVGIFNILTPKGTKNTNFRLNQLYTKAEYAKKNAKLKDYRSYRFFNGSFSARLLNTNREDWRIVSIFKPLNKERALDLKKELLSEYAKTHDVTGKAKSKVVRVTHETTYESRKEILNATKTQIYKIVKTLAAGLNVDLTQMQQEIYWNYVYSRMNTRQDFWVYLNENAVK